jgi:uncharacterized protein (DUF1501 family)
MNREVRRKTLDALKDLNELQEKELGHPETATRIAQYELAYRMQTAVPEVMDISREPAAVLEAYGAQPGEASFANNCLLARRLVEQGVPFIEVDLGGWDNHADIFKTLSDNKLPELDKAMAALVSDLAERGLLDDTAIIWMGEFSRTPNINGNGGRDHWARSWSVAVGGAGFKRGVVVGETSSDGKEVVTEPYSAQDLMASVLKSLDISLETTFTAKNGRPMKIANAGKVIKELFA